MTSLMLNTQTGITIIEREVIQKLPAGLQKFVAAKDSPKVIDLNPPDAEKFILNLIMETQLNTGHTKQAEDETTNAMAAGAVYGYIKDKFKTLTVKELKLAVLNGLTGEYGDFIGINLKTFSGWIKGYSTSELKKQAMSEWNKYIELVQVRKYSESEKDQIIISGCLHFWNDYKNAGLIKHLVIPVDKVCAIYYDFLAKKGVVNFGKDQLNEFSRKAKELYEAEITLSKTSRQIKKSDYEAIMDSITKDTNTHLKSKRRKIALIAFFDELITQKKDLKEIINQLINRNNKSKH